jgi:hypothetical protein
MRKEGYLSEDRGGEREESQRGKRQKKKTHLESVSRRSTGDEEAAVLRVTVEEKVSAARRLRVPAHGGVDERSIRQRRKTLAKEGANFALCGGRRCERKYK